MCEQTEIKYLDGDVVWVKLKSYWWPGQVVSLEKLPEDIQIEFKKKPLIAAVKFFQEDSFEFVKNYQCIYKYNCTQKEDFIKRGLDKYRIKSKNGSSYMNKFPEDIKTAETLTGGNPNILVSEKFSPEKKPDISGLFGEKKMLKRKRFRDDTIKHNSNDTKRKITHFRFIKGSDHEVRIRQQPKSSPSTVNYDSYGGIYPCHICGFTSSRINVIICHLKHHRLNKETSMKTKVSVNVQRKAKQISTDLSKQKHYDEIIYTETKNELKETESKKRKYSQISENFGKKKKSDAELREKLLADWNEESDDDTNVSETFLDKSLSNINQISTDRTASTKIISTSVEEEFSNNTNVLRESDKILKETNALIELSTVNLPKKLKSIQSGENKAKSFNLQSPKKIVNCHITKKITKKQHILENDEKKPGLSCFDFDEDDEPSISSVEMLPRNVGAKNSLKKQVIKEMNINQSSKSELKTDDPKYVGTFPELNVAEMEAQDKKARKYLKEEVNSLSDISKNDKKDSDKDYLKSIRTEKILEDQEEIVEILEIEKQVDNENQSEKRIEYTTNFDSIFKTNNDKISENNLKKIEPKNEKNTNESEHEKNENDKEKFFLENSCNKNENKTMPGSEDVTYDISNIHKKSIEIKNVTDQLVNETDEKNLNTNSTAQISKNTFLGKTFFQKKLTIIQNNDPLKYDSSQKSENSVKREIEIVENCNSNKTIDTKLIDSIQLPSSLGSDKISTEMCNQQHTNKNDSKIHILKNKNLIDLSGNVDIHKSTKEYEYENQQNYKAEAPFDENIHTSFTKKNVDEIKLNEIETLVDSALITQEKILISSSSNTTDIVFESNKKISTEISKDCFADSTPSVSQIKYIEKGNDSEENNKHHILTNSCIEKKIANEITIASNLKLNDDKTNKNFGISNINFSNLSKKVSIIHDISNEPECQSEMISDILSKDNSGKINVSVGSFNEIKQMANKFLIKSDTNLDKTDNAVENYSDCFIKLPGQLNSKSLLSQSILSSVTKTEDTGILSKKREKPRIIENVTLKEPMILKSKLIEKHSEKMNKRSLNHGKTVCNDTVEKCVIDKKDKNLLDGKDQSSSSTKSNKNIEMDGTVFISKINKNDDQTIHEPSDEQKIQLKQKNFINIEIDGNSTSFALSDDLLTPESIKQMPVIIPSVTLEPNSLWSSQKSSQTTPSKEKINTNVSQKAFINTSDSQIRKKSGTPSILKNKIKGKPTITSIKTIVPANTSVMFQKDYKTCAQPLTTNKKSTGRYIIVQTSGHQKADVTHKKIINPSNKSSSNAQIVQQGGKVVILTSDQSCQSSKSFVPINSFSKVSNNTKLKKIVAKKNDEICNSISSQNPKHMTIVKKEEFTFSQSPDKMLTRQHTVPSKNSVQSYQIKSIPSTSKNMFLKKNDLSSSKSISAFEELNIGTSISLGKKSLVLNSSDSPTCDQISNYSFTKKLITSPQSIISKGTILTPITGSQVKAIAAKNMKGNKQYHLSYNKVSNESQNTSKVFNSSPLLKKLSFAEKETSDIFQKDSELKESVYIKKNVSQNVKHSTPISKNTIISTKSKVKIQSTNKKEPVSNKNICNSQNIIVPSYSSEKSCTETNIKDLQSDTFLKNNQATLKLIKKTEHQKEINTTTSEILNRNTNKSVFKKISNANEPEYLFSTTDTFDLLTRDCLSDKDNTNPVIKDISSKNLQSEIDKTKIEKIQENTNVIEMSDSDNSVQTYVLVTVDNEGHIIPFDNSGLISVSESSDFEENKMLYIDSTTLCETKDVNNFMLHIDNSLSHIKSEQETKSDSVQSSKTFPSVEIVEPGNQDIIATALAKSDFQDDSNVIETVVSNALSTVDQTHLINQTILQSTIIPPTEPISSPLVLETSLTLNQPIMTPLEIPSNLTSQTTSSQIISRPLITNSPDSTFKIFHKNVPDASNDETLVNIINGSAPKKEKSTQSLLKQPEDNKKLNNIIEEGKISKSMKLQENNLNLKKIARSLVENDPLQEKIENHSITSTTSTVVFDNNTSTYCTNLSTEESKEVNSEKCISDPHSNEKDLTFDLENKTDSYCELSPTCASTLELVKVASPQTKHYFTDTEKAQSNHQLENFFKESKDLKIAENSLIYSKLNCGQLGEEESMKISHSNINLTTNKDNFNELITTPDKDITDSDTKSCRKEENVYLTQQNLSNVSPNFSSNSFEKVISIIKENKSEFESNNSNYLFHNYEYERNEIIKKDEVDEESNQNEINTELNEISSDLITSSSTTINNTNLNEDETASSSYIPETPENHERDQDQESAISTSSYEIPPCEDINIVSSNILSDAITESSNIDNNCISEISIPYNSNIDNTDDNEISILSYKDKVTVQSSTSTSYEISISLPNLEKTDLLSNQEICENSQSKIQSNNYYSDNLQTSENYFQNICKRSVCPIDSKDNLSDKIISDYYEKTSNNITEVVQDYFPQNTTTNMNEQISSVYYDSCRDLEESNNYYQDSNKSNSHLIFENVHTQDLFSVQDNQKTSPKENTAIYSNEYSSERSSENSSLNRHKMEKDSKTTNR